MGTTARLYFTNGPDELEQRLLTRLDDLEQRWSRFIVDSEISRVNAAAGGPVDVSRDTVLLVERALQASRRTGGWFDPTLLLDLVAAGYDRTFDQLSANGLGDLVITIDRRATGDVVRLRDWRAVSSRVVVDPQRSTVAVPAGAAFDPGGLGKGLAADLLAAMASEAGAAAVLIDLGGDIVTAGQAPDGGWEIAIEDPFDRTRELQRVRLPWGAMATSSRSRRRWVDTDGIERHHLIDPTTGEPSRSDVAACTVIAGECWLAEAYAKAVVVAGVEAGLELANEAGVEALVVDADGRRHHTPGIVGFFA